MSVLVPSTETEQDIFSTSNLFLQQRLKLIEDLWKEVLVSECGQELVDLLELLRHLCSEEGQVTDDSPEAMIAKMIEDLELGEAIKVTRAFALYFQLINIIEQHYEQRDQQLLRRTVIGEENESPKAEPRQKKPFSHHCRGRLARKNPERVRSLQPKIGTISLVISLSQTG